MYASIRRYTGISDPDEIARRAESGFLPLLQQSPGFNAYYVVVGEDGRSVASVSIFEDRAGAEDSNRRAAEWVRETLTELVPSAPEITAGEVRVHGTR